MVNKDFWAAAMGKHGNLKWLQKQIRKTFIKNVLFSMQSLIVTETWRKFEEYERKLE